MVKKIAVTGGSGQIAYSLIFRIANGDLFGKDQVMDLHIYDLPETESQLKAIQMELQDCAFPLINRVQVGSNLNESFEDIDCAFLVGAKPRTLGMERADLLMENGKIFVEQGKALNKFAKKETKVLVVGNPCNTNCLIAMHHAPSLSRKNFHAMLMLDHLRAQGLLAKKADVGVKEVKNVIIWGNHSSTQVPDFTHVHIEGKPYFDYIKDREWLQRDFFELVQKRGAAIIAARGKSSAASAANAALVAMHALYYPTEKHNWFSSAQSAVDNPYGIDEDLIFGFPCRTNEKAEVEIVGGLELDFFIREKIAITQKELIEEKKAIQHLL